MNQEVFEATRWSLHDLLPATEGAEFDALLADLESEVAALEAARSGLAPDLPAGMFAQLLARLERVATMAGRLRAYGFLWFSTDTQDQDALAFRGQVERLLAGIANRTLFFSLWWKELDDGPAERLMAASGDNRYYLESLRRFKPHTLSEAEEKIINLKDINGVNGLKTVYDMITYDFTFEVEIDGEVKELNRSELMVYARDARPEVRAAAYQALYGVYGGRGAVLGQIYQYVVRDWASENLDLRKFGTAIGVRNLHNDLPDEVVDTLLQVCRDNAGLFQRYFRLKAGWIGVDRLRRYDIYAPLSTAEKEYRFSQAASLVLSSMADFSPVLADHARRVLVEKHLDAEIRLRKDTGAFSYGPVPELTPWVLINYTGKASEVATLAHELGHAVHSMLAADHSPLTYHAPLPLAETASVFAEMLLLERLLADEPDQAVHRDLLARFVDDAYATVMRQAYFVLFEREAHNLISQGCTSDQLADGYLDLLREQFGDAVDLSDEFRWEWVSIPHIYDRPFYCYAYSFGQLLVLALYKRYREEGAPFVPGYLKILSYGGSASPVEILSEAGIDVASPAFWQGG
ncbi:MAG: M3 family oligoendopeptidase, partial [Anaerolineae bacterium]|nr:M3 family oligoendopeptidase [Anaerolineae bacterium]